ncbi:hypothetical protein CP556_15025 [Natrinema sp. CBA1119]|nr:hypothetical protein CP556_15025 [Natrinema sp. CBA1119]
MPLTFVPFRDSIRAPTVDGYADRLTGTTTTDLHDDDRLVRRRPTCTTTTDRLEYVSACVGA